MTGEEEETVELEAKSVKLYVKRGKKNFSEGMTGHIKVLASKGTDSERLRESSCISKTCDGSHFRDQCSAETPCGRCR